MGKRLALFGSGRGSNGEAIYTAIESGQIEGEIVLIISDRPHVGIVEKGYTWQIPVYIIDPTVYAQKEEWAQAMLDVLASYAVDGVLLAGYMRITAYICASVQRKHLEHSSLLIASLYRLTGTEASLTKRRNIHRMYRSFCG